jgi:ribonuclease Z
MTATFLGTSSGGGPTESRNCSSLILDVVGDGSLWSIFFQFIQELWLISRHAVIDGAEGTLRQFFLQTPKNGGKTLKVSQVSKIFVTHMHREFVTKCAPSDLFLIPTMSPYHDCIPADHVMGLPTLLRNILGFPHAEDISPRGTPVCVFVHFSDEGPCTDEASSA